MAVPKHKIGSSRRGNRRSHWHLSAPNSTKCPNCGASCRPHRVCRQCGHYGEREVIVVEKS